MLKILQEGNEILRKKAQEINLKDISSTKIQKIIKNMKETLTSKENGAALAAPQIGESIRLFIVSENIFEEDVKNKNLVYINPKITKESKQKKWLEEGCLSVAGVYGKVERAEKCTVQAYNEKGERFERGGSELLSQIFQHEIDHLNGVLFIDKAKELEAVSSYNNKI